MLKQAGIIQDFNLYSKTGLIILYTYFQIPLGVLLLYPAFDALREDWRESAALLGANGWQFWRHIGLPVLTPAWCRGMYRSTRTWPAPWPWCWWR